MALKKRIICVALIGPKMMSSGCAHGVDEVPVDTNYGLPVAVENAMGGNNTGPRIDSPMRGPASFAADYGQTTNGRCILSS